MAHCLFTLAHDSVSHLTLDDAATLLLQLEATDTVDLARLRDALTELAFENLVPLSAQPFVARAARVLGTILGGTASDPATAFAEVSQAIEDAMRASDAHAKAAPAAPAAASRKRTPRSVTPVRSPAQAETPLRVAAIQDMADDMANDMADDMANESANAPRVAVADAPPVATKAAAAPAVVAPAEATRSTQHDVGSDRLPDDADRDLLPDFITESRECVTNSESALLQLEENPTDEEAVNTVFRAFHTVKGTSAFLGLSRTAAFAHEAESLLSRVRDKEIRYTRGCANLSLRSVDMLKELLTSVEEALAGSGVLPLPAGYHELLDALAGYDPARDADGVTIAAVTSAAPADRVVGSTTDTYPAAPAAARQARTESTADATIRVRTDRLDRLIDMVGELVIAQSMIAGDDSFGTGKAHELQRKVTHAGKIVRELQDLSMSMRMVPLRATFQKLARVVRDTSVKAGKTVQFVTEGDDVEIDRTLVDVLGDPLVHMVRNAVDHGTEPPDERERLGKPRLGAVRLSAYHASGNVVVELRDDGRGLYREKLVKKAIEKGLIESDKGMSDSDVFALIFAPGFSTAETVTDISGRGVGMDVVRRNLEAIRGRIDITSVPGHGTTFAIRLPLTLAVTDGMLVRVGEERFIIPLTHIHMSFRPEPSMLSTVVGNGEVVLLRGELMPIIRLHQLFDVPNAVQSPLNGLLMIVGDGTRRSALLVDDLLGQQQVVAKTLGSALGKVPGVSGGAILGDGRVGLILDVNETVALAQSHDVAPLKRDRDRQRDVAA